MAETSGAYPSRKLPSRIDFAGHADEKAKDSDRLPLRERISFVYDSIQWEWTIPSAVEEDIYSSKT